MQESEARPSNLATALAWAVGGPPIEEQQFTEGEFISAVRDHRIAGRIIERAAGEPQAWLSAGLLQVLAEEHERQIWALEQRIETVTELVQAYGNQNEPIVVIKGFSTFLLTGRRRAWARSSTDVDIFAGNAEAAIAHLIELGYDFDSGPAPHELARMVRGGAYIELHSYIPVYSGPSPDEEGRSPWERRSVKEIHSLKRRDIRYTDLLRDASLFSFNGADVLVPSAELATLIIYSHLYRNQLSLPGPSRFATVRLCDIADLMELKRLAAFRVDVFEALVAQFQAHAAVAYAERLTDAILHRDADVHRSRLCLDRSLWWDNGQGGFICDTFQAETPADLLVRGSVLSDLLGKLGANDVDAGTGGVTPLRYSTVGREGSRLLRLVGANSVHSDLLELDLTVSWELNFGLRFEVSVLPRLADPNDRESFLWNFGTAIFECEYGSLDAFEATISDRLHDPGTELADISASTAQNRVSRLFFIPWSVLGQTSATQPLSLILGVRRRRRLVALPHSATIVPMRIHEISLSAGQSISQ